MTDAMGPPTDDDRVVMIVSRADLARVLGPDGTYGPERGCIRNRVRKALQDAPELSDFGTSFGSCFGQPFCFGSREPVARDENTGPPWRDEGATSPWVVPTAVISFPLVERSDAMVSCSECGTVFVQSATFLRTGARRHAEQCSR